MLAGSELVAFVATSDPERAHDFYEHTLGLPAIERTQYACVFEAGATRLRVTVVDHVTVAPYTVLGWCVEDIDATVVGLARRGVECVRFDGLEQDEQGVWSAPGGARIAWFRDPDGNLLSAAEMPGGQGAPGRPPGGDRPG